MGMLPADLPATGASSPDFHAHSLLPCTFFLPSGSHHLSLYSNQGTVSSAFMLPVKLPYSLCKGDAKTVFVNVLTLYIYGLTIFYASIVLQSCLIFMSRWIDSYWVNKNFFYQNITLLVSKKWICFNISIIKISHWILLDLIGSKMAFDRTAGCKVVCDWES